MLRPFLFHLNIQLYNVLDYLFDNKFVTIKWTEPSFLTRTWNNFNERRWKGESNCVIANVDSLIELPNWIRNS